MDLIFIVKLILLALGLYNLPWGAVLIILHGYFHLIKDKDNIKDSPDWVIAKHYLGIEGIPVWMHKIIGIVMIGYSFYWINSLFNNTADMYTEMYPKFTQIILLVIIFEVIMKKVISGAPTTI